MTSRGERNNNPGNIRLSTIQWRGQVPPSQQTDTSFIQFTDPVFGIRAIVRILTHYKLQGVDTVGEAIDRWAPPTENDSVAYVNDVAAECGVAPTDKVDLQKIIPALVAGIIRHENGEQPYSEDQISKAIALA